MTVPLTFSALFRASLLDETVGSTLRNKMVALVDPANAVVDILQAMYSGIPLFNANGPAYRNGINTDTQALQAASDAAYANGGGTVTAYGAWSIAGPVTFREGVNLVGGGSSQNASGSGTVYTCTSPTASLRFGDQTVNHAGGWSHGFHVNANNIATTPFYVGCAVGRIFSNIDIQNSAQDGLTLVGCANSYFLQVNVLNHARDAACIDRSFGNVFERCEFGAAGRYNLALVALSDDIPVGGPSNYPSWNEFSRCFIEYTTASTQALVYQGAGIFNSLYKCLIATGQVAPPASLPLIKLEKAGTPFSVFLQISECLVVDTLNTGTSIGIVINGVEPRLMGAGYNYLQLLDVGIKRLAVGGGTSHCGNIVPLSVTTNRVVTAGQEAFCPATFLS